MKRKKRIIEGEGLKAETRLYVLVLVGIVAFCSSSCKKNERLIQSAMIVDEWTGKEIKHLIVFFLLVLLSCEGDVEITRVNPIILSIEDVELYRIEVEGIETAFILDSFLITMVRYKLP